MCGILYTSFNLSNDEISKTESLVKLRGPDYRNIQNISGNTFAHYLLHITGAKTPQPLIKENSILIYNGEIYNYKKLGEYESDGYSILDVFNNQNIDGLRSLDGEFSGVIKKENFIYIFRDTFGTKPLFFSEDQRGIAVASYQSQLHALGFKSAKRAPVNCVLRYNLNTKEQTRYTLREFNLNQHKNNFDDWESAFIESIKKRTENTQVNYFIGLSGGYDSGLISHTLNKLNKDYFSYSVVAEEDYKTLVKRGKLSLKHKLIKLNKKQYDQQKKFVNKFCEEFKGSFNYSVRKDKGTIGTGIICELAKKDGCKVYLSGQGADEILSDYGYNGDGPIYSEIKGLYPESLESVFPWRNVYNGQQENFIMKDENIGGAYSIECRYPFLDTNLVQEFLWLNAKLKNKNYKSPIYHLLKRDNYPLHPNGFAGKTGFRANKF